MLALTLLVGGAAACSDDDDKSADDSAQDSGTDEGSTSDDGGSDSGNAEISEYCDAVQELVDTPFEDIDQAQVTDLTTAGADLAARATEFSQEELQEIQDCTSQLQELGP